MKRSVNHQRCWLWGRHAVTEALAAGRWVPIEVRVADHLPADEVAPLQRLTSALDVPLHVESSARLGRWVRTKEHQGYLAKMPDYPYADLNEALEQRPDRPLWLILDRIQDPYNFGAIIRSAEVFGVQAIIVGERFQSTVTPHVARSSAGAVNHVTVARVSDLVQAVDALHSHGVEIIAASNRADASIGDVDLRGLLAVVIGNEAEGIDGNLQSRCDRVVSIPQHGQTESLNAAVAAGVLLYEVARQRCTPPT